MNPPKKPNRDQKPLGDALFGTRLGEAATNADNVLYPLGIPKNLSESCLK